MELSSWLISFFFASLISLCSAAKWLIIDPTLRKKAKFPPGPLRIPIWSDLQWLSKTQLDIEPILRDLRRKYGSVVSLPLGPKRVVFITSHESAHKALIQHGSAFADRPPQLEVGRIFVTDTHSVSLSSYGSLWRLFRRNLSMEILHSSKFKSFAQARKWALDNLKNKIRAEALSSSASSVICMTDLFDYTIYGLFVLLCFGDKVDEKGVREIIRLHREVQRGRGKFNFLSVYPRLTKILFRKKWSELYELQSKWTNVILSLVKARQETLFSSSSKFDSAYVDSLMDMTLPEELGGTRKLNERELVTLCTEFFDGGVDTTSAALQWIVANMVNHRDIQRKLFNEIKNSITTTSSSDDDEMIREEDLHKLPYLKAVILEGLRRHPPAHFVLPHSVSEDVLLDGYVIPKGTTVNFTVADFGWDSNVWEDPMDFRPERFLGSGGDEGLDITGTKDIKMIPFGAGRRMCPAHGLAMLHLQYFVANLVKEFEFNALEGVAEVDLSEKPKFLATVMKSPLRVHIKLN